VARGLLSRLKRRQLDLVDPVAISAEHAGLDIEILVRGATLDLARSTLPAPRPGSATSTPTRPLADGNKRQREFSVCRARRPERTRP
jgi:hypothetical protein